jgi:uncharacterized repeat protein (TIGR03803 family)
MRVSAVLFMVAGLGAVLLATPATAQAQGEAVIYAFQGPTTDGENNTTGLVAGSGGVLYGTTTYGGSGNCSGFGYSSPIGCGIVYELTPPATSGGAWTETVIYSFTGAVDGAFPNTLTASKSGILYGTTFGGGPRQSAGSGHGVVFKLTPPTTSGGAWKETVMYSFCKETNCADGQNPNDGPILVGADLYGTTGYGGSSGFGTVYQLTTAAKPVFTSLYSFKGGSTDGANPYYGLIANKSGTLYGETNTGGGTGCGGVGCGIVYELTPPATAGNPYTETVLYTFPGGANGQNLSGRLTLSGSDLYGVAGGGSFNYGLVYKLAPPATGTVWTETVLTSFDPGNLYGVAGGTFPNGNLVVGANGSIYGTTYGGGDPNLSFGYYFPGTIFELTPPIATGGAWVQSLLYTFQGGSDGLTPEWGLITGPDGTLYGTTSVGGGSGCPAQAYNGMNVGCGTVFQFTP